MTLGNDFTGTIVTVGKRVPTLAVGDRVYGVKPASRDGSHASHVVVNSACARKAPAHSSAQDLAALPYSFITMWLAVRAAGLTRENAAGKKVLVHGASGGLGTLALQTLSAWGARVTAIAKASDFSACREAGAVEVMDRTQNPFAGLRGAFDATLNFATWDDDAALLTCLREGALGHATTVHPLLQNFDEAGWVGGAIRTLNQKREMRKRLPKGELATTRGSCFGRKRKRFLKWRDFAELGRLLLPIGPRTPLREAAAAFAHVRRRLAGRALLIPQGESRRGL